MAQKRKGGGKVPVTTRAVVQRINRKLKDKGQQLRATRGASARSHLGDYYVIDHERNFVIDQHAILKTWARDLGVLQPWEELVD